MNETDILAITAWLTSQGLRGTDEMDMVNGFCARCRAAGLRLDRGVALIDTLHPIYEGRAFQWDSEESFKAAFEYGRTDDDTATDNWARSSFHFLQVNGQDEVRRRLGFGEPADFYRLDELLLSGHTDYVAMIHRFVDDGPVGDMECFYSYWATRHENGFRKEDLDALRRLVPGLALAVKSRSLTRIARTIAEVYLGEDAARQVLDGRISRGKVERISAVLWFSDLQNYTRISDSLPPDDIIPFLNDYTEAVITAIHHAGGNVLKMMGDGVLAIFKAEEREDACSRALSAHRQLRLRLKEMNDSRSAQDRPVTEVYLGLHIGDVFYGNIGSSDRLDFTVIGPAVNEVSRIASMCRVVERSVIMSSAFVSAAPPLRDAETVSIGRYALRGVALAQELFTLMPLEAPSRQEGGNR